MEKVTINNSGKGSTDAEGCEPGTLVCSTIEGDADTILCHVQGDGGGCPGFRLLDGATDRGPIAAEDQEVTLASGTHDMSARNCACESAHKTVVVP